MKKFAAALFAAIIASMALIAAGYDLLGPILGLVIVLFGSYRWKSSD